MSSTKATTGQIHKAIEDLIRQGSNPTMARVRTALGDRGNANTILAGIQSWYADRGAHLIALLDQPDAVAGINLKTAMRDATKSSVSAINKINAEYEKKVAEETKRLQDIGAQLDLREKSLQEAAVAKDAHIADLQARLAKLDEELHLVRVELKLERDMVADLESRLAHQVHDAAVQVAVYQEQIANAGRLTQAMTDEHAQTQAALRSLQANHNELKDTLSAAKAELQLQSTLFDARTAELTQQIHVLTATHQQQREVAEQQIQALSAEAVQSKTETKCLQALCNQLESAVAAANLELQRQTGLHAAQISESHKDIKQLSSQNAALEAKLADASHIQDLVSLQRANHEALLAAIQMKGRNV